MADPRDADTIRDQLLSTAQGEFDAIGERIVTAPKSFLHTFASALSIDLEGAEFEAYAARQEAFPDSASEAGLLKHADFDGVTRLPDVAAQLRVQVTGTPSSLLTIPAGKTLTDAQGLVYNAQAGNVTTNGGGVAYATIDARDAGTEQNLQAGDVLTWQNGAPAGMASTVTVASDVVGVSPLLVVGSEEESLDALRARVVVFHRERPQAGNRAAWVASLEEVEGVGAAFVWPRSRDNPEGVLYGVPGTLVAMVLAVAPAADSYVQDDGGDLGYGLRPDTTRSPSTALRTRAVDYMEGRVDASGRGVPDALQRERHSASINDEDYVMMVPGLRTVDVVVSVVVDPGIAPWPWGVSAGPPAYRTITAATSTTVTVDNAFEITGNSKLAVFVGTSIVRGGWWLATVASVAGDVLTLSSELPVDDPSDLIGNLTRPDPGLWQDIRAIVLAYFDQMGPGDAPSTDPAYVRSARFPRPTDLGPDRIFTSRIIDGVQDLRGIAGVTDVGLSYTDAALPHELIVPGRIQIARG